MTANTNSLKLNKKLLLNILIPIALSLASYVPAQAQTYVQNYDDFKEHIRLHRARVLKLGLELATHRYPGINFENLEAYLKLHDLSKTDLPKTTLEKFGFDNYMKPSFYLFSFYGLTKMTRNQESELKDIVVKMNSIDQKISAKFFEKKVNLSSQSIEQIKKIEKVADLVDRSMDPVAAEEFGRTMMPASQYLREPDLIPQAKFLETHYKRIVKGLEFKRRTQCAPLFD